MEEQGTQAGQQPQQGLTILRTETAHTVEYNNGNGITLKGSVRLDSDGEVCSAEMTVTDSGNAVYSGNVNTHKDADESELRVNIYGVGADKVTEVAQAFKAVIEGVRADNAQQQQTE